MRRVMISALIFMIILVIMPVQILSKEAGTSSAQSDIKVIPDEAIRLRILANSDKPNDQKLKRKVRDEVNASITEWVEDITDINDARKLIQEKIPEIRAIAANVVQKESEQQDLEVKYGKNITFPAKLYGSYMYPPGEYEAVLITLGEGKGANWWCVLFPPLCFLDFSNGTSVAEAEGTETEEKVQNEDDEKEEAEVKFFLFEWFS
ncbi:stage II sporulation protein R [Lentibacillus kapialis]|uniref:Stage II sporulation protein R n=1 Tax=Lentibacillus kapialis TaxID=340214 RepID=A0A917PUN6_9BACI|nr:stage II sporulation protein R [Lentibacillus kapialis]GGJ91990.1 stage II sporulation protein R [Lentibacillus kapialis]